MPSPKMSTNDATEQSMIANLRKIAGQTVELSEDDIATLGVSVGPENAYSSGGDDIAVVAKNPDEIGGDTVVSELPDGYEGPCVLVADDWTPGTTLAVFPSVFHAMSAASCALSPEIGGYGSVIVAPAQEDDVTHDHWQDWVLG